MELTIGEVAERSGVTRRTIRYYVEIGLLPPPSGAGKAAVYGDEHLERLELIKKLQSMRLSLEEIREELAGRRRHMVADMASREVASAMMNAAPMTPAPATTAAEYIARLRELEPAYEQRMVAKPVERGAEYDAEPWVRVTITPDVELHVRRRGARSQRWLWRLVKEARRILEEEKEET
jgi:DNA-binding transcriptional MerR regulator